MTHAQIKQASEKVAEGALPLKFPRVDYSMLPEHMQDGARLYVEHGVPPARSCRRLFAMT